MKNISDHFKTYLKPSNLYVGGLTRDEVASIIGDKKLYKLSSNENICGASPMALEAIKAHVDGLYEYPDRSDTALRHQLAEFYKGEIASDQFITANSGSEIIELIVRAFINEGDEFIVSNPCFKPYQMSAEKLGGIQVDVPLKDNDYALDGDGIIEAITDKTRIIFLTTPNNPTGTYIPKSTLQSFMEQVPKDILIVMDEVYALFADADDYSDAVPFVKQGFNVIAVNSFSKTFGLAGLRLGYAYTTATISSYIQRLYKPFPLSTLTLQAGIAGLKDEGFLKTSTNLVKEQRPLLYKELDRIGMQYYPSQANFIMIRPTVDAKELTDALLKEGVMVRPVAGFGAPGCVRVTVGDAEANKAYIAALEKVLPTLS